MLVTGNAKKVSLTSGQFTLPQSTFPHQWYKMEGIVRALQGSGDVGPAHVVAFLDNTKSIACDEVFLLFLEHAATAIADRRWETSISVVAIDRPPELYHAFFRSIKFTDYRIIDCWTDPYGWSRRKTDRIDEKQQGTDNDPVHLFQQHNLDHLYTALNASHSTTSIVQPPPLVVFDGVSPLVDRYGISPFNSFLSALKSRTTGIFISLHADLHPKHHINSLCYGAVCVAVLNPPVTDPTDRLLKPSDGTVWHGRLSVKYRRKSSRGGGLIKTENLDYRISSAQYQSSSTTFDQNRMSSSLCSVVMRKVGHNMNNSNHTNHNNSSSSSNSRISFPNNEPSTMPSTTGTIATSRITKALGVGMRLEVSAEEAAARREVQLPYEHQGQGQLYAAGTDFRDYLPAAAGGRRKDNGRLGHIMYVRDSDSEDPDSDEDPDDDLDV